MTNQESLDETDIKILKLLQQNSHMTVKELAARVHLSTSPTFERQNDWSARDISSATRPWSTITRWDTTSSCYATFDSSNTHTI